jgi:hypothetical protein
LRGSFQNLRRQFRIQSGGIDHETLSFVLG